MNTQTNDFAVMSDAELVHRIDALADRWAGFSAYGIAEFHEYLMLLQEQRIRENHISNQAIAA